MIKEVFKKVLLSESTQKCTQKSGQRSTPAQNLEKEMMNLVRDRYQQYKKSAVLYFKEKILTRGLGPERSRILSFIQVVQHADPDINSHNETNCKPFSLHPRH